MSYEESNDCISPVPLDMQMSDAADVVSPVVDADYSKYIPNLQRQPAKPILKHNQPMADHHGDDEEHIRWDEENLEKNEAERVPCMKIDEPPTPFHGADTPGTAAGELPPVLLSEDLDAFSLNPLGHKAELTTTLANTQYNKELAREYSPSEESSEEEDDPYEGMTEEEIRAKEEKQKRFEAMRKSHYQGVATVMHKKFNPLTARKGMDSSDEDSDYKDE